MTVNDPSVKPGEVSGDKCSMCTGYTQMVGSKMLSVLRMWTDIIGSVGDQRRKPEKTLPNASMSQQTKSLCARVRVLHTHPLITTVVLSSCSVYVSIYALASIKHFCPFQMRMCWTRGSLQGSSPSPSLAGPLRSDINATH